MKKDGMVHARHSVYGEKRVQEKNWKVLSYFDGLVLLIYHMYRCTAYEYTTLPQHCFPLIMLISDCKIRQQALVEREMLFLDLDR